MNKESHSKAWNLLKEKGLKIGEMVFVRKNFCDFYKDDYPFVGIKYKKGAIEYYHSEIKEISNITFESENEVILANAIYENTKENFNINEFIQQLKFTFRILGVSSKLV